MLQSGHFSAFPSECDVTQKSLRAVLFWRWACRARSCRDCVSYNEEMRSMLYSKEKKWKEMATGASSTASDKRGSLAIFFLCLRFFFSLLQIFFFLGWPELPRGKSFLGSFTTLAGCVAVCCLMGCVRLIKRNSSTRCSCVF